MAVPGSSLAAQRSTSSHTHSLEQSKRPSLDLSRPRRSSLEAKFSQRSAEASSSGLEALSGRGIRLEVGQAVDINEQKRRLEANWNSRDGLESIQDTVSVF